MTNQTDGWLTIREAALQLRVSELTIRRRIKDGRVAHRLDGGKYYINLALPAQQAIEQPIDQAVITQDEPDQSDHNGRSDRNGADGRAPAAPRIDLDGLLGEHRRLAEEAGRAGLLAERVRDLESRHSELQDALVSLANRNGWLESKLEEREREVKLLADSRKRVPWWRRLFGAGAAG